MHEVYIMSRRDTSLSLNRGVAQLARALGSGP